MNQFDAGLFDATLFDSDQLESWSPVLSNSPDWAEKTLFPVQPDTASFDLSLFDIGVFGGPDATWGLVFANDSNQVTSWAPQSVSSGGWTTVTPSSPGWTPTGA